MLEHGFDLRDFDQVRPPDYAPIAGGSTGTICGREALGLEDPG
jgi:hypothetical protein